MRKVRGHQACTLSTTTRHRHSSRPNQVLIPFKQVVSRTLVFGLRAMMFLKSCCIHVNGVPEAYEL